MNFFILSFSFFKRNFVTKLVLISPSEIYYSKCSFQIYLIGGPNYELYRKTNEIQ
jgi:hypothetical protein